MPTEVRAVGGWKVLPIRDLQICRSGRHESIVPPKPNNTDDLDAALRGYVPGTSTVSVTVILSHRRDGCGEDVRRSVSAEAVW